MVIIMIEVEAYITNRSVRTKAIPFQAIVFGGCHGGVGHLQRGISITSRATGDIREIVKIGGDIILPSILMCTTADLLDVLAPMIFHFLSGKNQPDWSDTSLCGIIYTS